MPIEHSIAYMETVSPSNFLSIIKKASVSEILGAIAHLVANVLPNLGIAEMARVQVQLALRDYVKNAV